MDRARMRALVSALLMLVSALFAPGARAGEFHAGNYTYTDKAGVKSCVLNFAQDPKAPSRYIASGWVGSIMRVPVTGLYTAADNRFTGGWLPISFGDLPTVSVAELRGEWSATQDVLFIRYTGGPSMPLKFDPSEPDPNAPKIAIKSVDLEPAVNGALLKGRVTLGVSNLKLPAIAELSLSLQGDVENSGLSTLMVEIPGNGDHTVELARIPAAVPVSGSEIDVKLDAYLQDADPSHARWKRTVPAAGLTRPVALTQFAIDGMTVQPPRKVNEIGWTYVLAWTDLGATDRKLRIEVTETVTVFSAERPADVLKCQPVTRTLACPLGGAAAPVERLKIAELLPGPYSAVVRVESPYTQPYNGVIQFFVDVPPRENDGADAQTDPAAIGGSATVGATLIKPGETTPLSVRYGFDKGPDTADVDAVIELVDPKGVTAKRIAKRVALRKGTPAEHKFTLTSDIPGVHTVKVRVSGAGCNPWETTTTFTVEKPAPTGEPKPPGGQQGNAAEQGTFGLVKTVVGRPPDAGDGESQYGVMTCTISQNACGFHYVCKPPYKGELSLNATFSTPPAVLRPGDIIELTCSGSGSVSGNDVGGMGIGCHWGADGSCETLEGKKFFIGRASDGKFYSSGQSTFKVKIGSGGKIQLTAAQGGLAWGHNAIWNPCEYHYLWNAPPIEPGGGDAEKGEEQSKGASLTSTDPDDETIQFINAWLDPGVLTLYAGEPSRIVDIHIEHFRTDTVDRVEVIFPQKTDDWASLPGQIVVNGGNGSYDPANMGRPVHVDGYFFAARETAPGGDFEIEIIVRQKKAGFVRLKLPVHVVRKPPRPQDPGAGAGPGTLPPVVRQPTGGGRTWPQGDTSGPARDFSGRWTTNLGVVSIVQRVATVEGTYPGGVISGTVTGSVLTLRMDERAYSPFAGYGRWVLNASGDEFDGGWTPSPSYGPPVHVWNGRKTTAGGASPHVMDPRGGIPNGPVTRGDGQGATGGTGPGGPPKPGTLDLTPAGFARQGWTSVGAGASVKVEGDRLVFDAPKASDGAAESFSPMPLDGDFDVSIDYEHIDWAFRDDLSLSWSVFLSPVPHTESRELVQVMRTSGDEGRGFGDLVINASSKSEPLDVRALTDKTGTLRIARSGNTVRIWQRDGSGWKQAASFETALPPKLHLGFVLERQGDGGAKVSLRPHPTR